MKSENHFDKFTGIHDKNGIPILNGDKIRVYDRSSKNPEGFVVWNRGNYEFRGSGIHRYNIYAWRNSIEVLETNRESVFLEIDFQDLIDTMHLTRNQVKELLPLLEHFVKTGRLAE